MSFQEQRSKRQSGRSLQAVLSKRFFLSPSLFTCKRLSSSVRATFYLVGGIMLNECWGEKGWRLTEYGAIQHGAKASSRSGSQGLKRGGCQVS